MAIRRSWLTYDFVVRVPVPLNVATQRMQGVLDRQPRFFRGRRPSMEGRVFRIYYYYRWPIATEGQVVPNDAGTTDIQVHVPAQERLISIALLVAAVAIVIVNSEELPIIAALWPVAIALFFFLVSRIRGPLLQRDIVAAFENPP